LDRTGPEVSERDQVVLGALGRNRDFQTFAFPKRMIPPVFSRYDPGMEYGPHVDNAVMSHASEPLRTDLAATIFLSDPASYESGELALDLTFGEQESSCRPSKRSCIPPPVCTGLRP
jgi:PKHD-type hydroxylase